jgi:hypothetical protein
LYSEEDFERRKEVATNEVDRRGERSTSRQDAVRFDQK